MDIGKIEKIGDRELPGVPTFPQKQPAVTPQKAPSTPAPAPQRQPEKVPA